MTSTSTSTLSISVMVPTYRRPADLKRCLDALRAQARPADEVLVVARPEDDATHRALESVFGQRIAVHAVAGRWVALPNEEVPA